LTVELWCRQNIYHREEPPLFFWRDQTGHEIDLLIHHTKIIN